ncbi:hypothetical protein HanIR_Chr00c06g0905421 [Helianthus annuus]|nr:hypothetical protein HanIR_Chr00c06g0905421 [Helianthus annuus]
MMILMWSLSDPNLSFKKETVCIHLFCFEVGTTFHKLDYVGLCLGLCLNIYVCMHICS